MSRILFKAKSLSDTVFEPGGLSDQSMFSDLRAFLLLLLFYHRVTLQHLKGQYYKNRFEKSKSKEMFILFNGNFKIMAGLC